MEKFKEALIGIVGALLLVFAVVASVTLNSTAYSSNNSSDANNSSAPAATTPTATTTKAPETTPSTTKTETTPVTTKAPETTAEVTTEPLEWAEEAINATMYVNQNCSSRVKAIIGSDAVKQYTYGEAVNVIAITDTGYYKLGNGEYIHGDYLSETEL